MMKVTKVVKARKIKMHLHISFVMKYILQVQKWQGEEKYWIFCKCIKLNMIVVIIELNYHVVADCTYFGVLLYGYGTILPYYMVYSIHIHNYMYLFKVNFVRNLRCINNLGILTGILVLHSYILTLNFCIQRQSFTFCLVSNDK